MKKRSFRITDQDQECFLMLWKWKLLTTAALKMAAYNQKSFFRAYRRLLELEKANYIQSLRSLDQKYSVWQLMENGFNVIEEKLGSRKHDGFGCENKNHDFWVTAIHLGEWLKDVPENCDLYSEQQLRKYDLTSYPDWVPSNYEHRPDGWWSIGLDQPRENMLIALEVEFSKKSPGDYKLVGEFYSKIISPYQVIWVVKSKGDIDYIFKNLKAGSTTDAEEQSFVLLDHYIQHQWQSQIYFGKNKDKKVSDILCASAPQSSAGSLLLDIRKLPIESSSPSSVCKAEMGLSRQY